MNIPGPVYFSPVARSIPFDNSTNGFVSTNVQAAIEETSNFLTVNEITATADATTTSSTDALINSMTTTPVAGTYLVFFNASATSNTAGAAISFSYYLAGSQIAATLRKIIPLDGGTLSVGSARGLTGIHQKVTFNGSQALEVRWSISSGTGTCHQRVLTSIRIA